MVIVVPVEVVASVFFTLSVCGGGDCVELLECVEEEMLCVVFAGVQRQEKVKLTFQLSCG